MTTAVVTAPPIRAAAPTLDSPRHDRETTVQLRFIARLGASVSLAIGTVVLVGYVFRWAPVVQLRPSWPPMYPNTALAFFVGGLASLGATSRRWRIRVVSGVGFGIVVVGAGITLILNALDVGSTVLEGLWPDDPFVAATTLVAGRPVVEACVALITAGVAGALVASGRTPRVAQGLALGTMGVGSAAMMGYIIGVDRAALGTSFVLVGMALHTAVGLTALGLAVLFAQPTVGLIGGATHSGPGAQLSRRLVAAVVVAPVLLAAATALLADLLPDARLFQSVVSIVQIIALGLLVIVPLASADRMQQAADADMREARAVKEALGEQGIMTRAIRTMLLESPVAPSGWHLGFRQTAAFGQSPGDSCQLLRGADGSFLLALIDMAGHGTRPALQVMRLRIEIATLWNAGSSIDYIADTIERSVSELDTIGTGVLLRCDTVTGACEYVNAGHPAVIVAYPSAIDSLARTRPLFGIGGAGSCGTFTITRDTVVIAYTDGITEARTATGGLLGVDAIHEALRLHAASGPQAIADACVDAALAHGQSRLIDDALVVVLAQH